MNPKEQTYLWYIVIVRVYVGYYLLQQGTLKYLRGFPQSDWITGSIGDLNKIQIYDWYRSFLINVVAPHRELFGYLVMSGEILIGLCLFLGLLTRFSSIMGIFLLLNYYFGPGMAKGGASLAQQQTFIILLAVIALSRPGRSFGLDGLLFLTPPKKGSFMKFNTGLTGIVAIVAFAASGQAAQIMLAPSMPSITPVQSSGSFSVIPQLQIAARLFTPAVLEPNGFIAVCLATNLDTVPRDMVAQIINSGGAEVTQTSSCGARMPSGVTCDSTAHFANNLPLRCVIGTGGNATTLRGGMTTSSGPFPFTSPANLTVPAQ
jgi:uncharacterized membrane protein YphA (DoxX/SURF4 family)